MSESVSRHSNADVRMRGFVERSPVDDALAWLDEQLTSRGTLASENLAIDQAHGRVLAEPIVSSLDVPSFERAMMDGYALRVTDIATAAADHPVELEVIGTCCPGEVYAGKVAPGQAVRIMTGAALPAGVDAVLPVEQTRLQGERVLALASMPAGKNRGSVGEDIRAGELLFDRGRVLRPQDVGVLSSIGRATVDVVRRPRVRIVVTGSELLPVGEPPTGNRIADANGPMLQSLVARDGGVPNHPGIVADDRDAILSAINADADIVITSGGSSVGQEDHVPTLLAEHGKLAIHGISMRPASAVGMGTLNGRLVLLLPGNPVACLWGYDLLAGRAVRRLGGRSTTWPYPKTTCELTREVVSRAGRTDYVRVALQQSTAAPVQHSGASVLSSTTRADGFIVVPAAVQAYAVGEAVDVFLYDSNAT